MDGQETVAVIGLLNEQVETVKEDILEAVAEVEAKTENQGYNQKWMEERLTQLERNQAELLEKIDSLVVKMTMPGQSEPEQSLLEEVEDDLKNPQLEAPAAPASKPFLIF